MPFNRPTLTQLIDRVAADIETRLPSTDARLPGSNLDVLGRVHAGAAHMLYGHLAWLALQLMPDTAEIEHLERWSSIWGVARKAAARAAGPIVVTGTTGAVVPSGTVLQRSDSREYISDAEATLVAGTATVSVTAVDGGVAGNAAAGASLSFVSPIAGVVGTAVIDAGGLTGGTDLESDASLRERLLERIQEPPHGGASFDYVAWAREITGVSRAWVYPLELGLGTVSVRFVVDDDPGGLIPDAAKVQAVQDHIDSVRPVTAAVTVVAPVAVDLDLTISGLNPSSAAVQAAISAELSDLLRREAEPGGTILLSHIREAISVAAGEFDHALTSPVADVAHNPGEIAVLGTIIWA